MVLVFSQSDMDAELLRYPSIKSKGFPVTSRVGNWLDHVLYRSKIHCVSFVHNKQWSAIQNIDCLLKLKKKRHLSKFNSYYNFISFSFLLLTCMSSHDSTFTATVSMTSSSLSAQGGQDNSSPNAR
jgi:hypothetical protein